MMRHPRNLAKIIVVILANLIGIHTANAGVLELLSQGAYFLSPSGRCADYSDEQVNLSLTRAECQLSDSTSGLENQTAMLSRIGKKITTSSEDRFFALLAKQHSQELVCAGDFATSIASGDIEAMEHLNAKFKLLRVAKQNLIQATKNVSSDPKVLTKACPHSLEDLEPSSVPNDESNEACKMVITARSAYQTIESSIPLANLPSVRTLIENYANLPQGDDVKSLNTDLNKNIKSAYAQAKSRLLDDSKKINETLQKEGGAGFDRAARHSLLSDPRVVTKVIQDGGDKDDMKSLALRARCRSCRLVSIRSIR